MNRINIIMEDRELCNCGKCGKLFKTVDHKFETKFNGVVTRKSSLYDNKKKYNICAKCAHETGM